ncbi:MAG: glycosyl transferase, group 1 [Deltaproteobacteria bacterium]|jgi:alpha-1,3-rhamnosyl/mannosyltransferase|nr:glycosyl transferase, group 1 [Deltaproteobacteria bacterium]
MTAGRLTICLDARVALGNRRGWGRYASELAAALAREEAIEVIVLLPTSDAASEFQGSIAGINRLSSVTTPYQPDAPDAFWTCAGAGPPDDFVGSVDLIHSLTRFVQPGVHSPTVVTIHDIAPLSPTPYKPHYAAATRKALELIKTHRCGIIAVSQATKDEVLREGTLSGSEITVIHEAAADVFHHPVRTSGRPSSHGYFLCVGGAGPNKNLERLWEAITLLRERGTEVELVFAGSEEWGYDQLPFVSSTQQTARFVRHVTDAELANLYANATALILPSLHEGFGLPIVEAIACGTPILCSDIPPFRELAQSCAIFFDPLRPDSIASAIQGCLASTDLRARFIERSGRLRPRFTWSRVAQETLNLYRRFLERQPI